MPQLICKEASGIFYMLWGGEQYDAWTASRHDEYIDHVNGTFNGFNLLDMRQFRLKYYKENLYNIHHVTLDSYIKIVYPYISKMFGFPYKRGDFSLKEYYGDGMDCSFLYPKQEMKWTVSIDQKTVAEHEGFDCLTNVSEKYPGCTGSAYHRIFSSSHVSCRILNESLPDEGSIAITGDSYMIPVIPILACYYNEVVYLDNRLEVDVSNAPYYDGKLFDRVIVSLSEENPYEKYIGWNLK